MIKPVEICFNGMGRSEFIENTIHEHLRQIEKHYNEITSCYVSVSAPHKSHRHGNQREVHIRAHVPGTEVAVSHHHSDSDINVLIRDAFSAFESQLQKRKSKLHRMHRTALIEEPINESVDEPVEESDSMPD